MHSTVSRFSRKCSNTFGVLKHFLFGLKSNYCGIDPAYRASPTSLEVTLILLIVGLCYGMLNDSKNRTAGIGADVIVQPPGSTFLAGISGAPVSIKIANLLAKVPHVTAVSPVIWQVSTGGALEVIDGIDLKSFEAIGVPFRFVNGGPFQGPDDAIIDDYIAL